MNFDNLYSKNPNLYGREPSDRILKIPQYYWSKIAKVLDLGICYWRNAIFLAKEWYDVTWVDISKVAIEQCLDEAKKNNLQVKCICQDISNFVFNEDYDIIYSTATLHYLWDKQKIDKVIENMKNHTKIGWLNIISAPTDTKIGMEMPFYFKKEDFLNYYKDREILESGEEEDTFTSGKVWTIGFLIAKRKE